MFSDEAKADIRAIPQHIAMNILTAIHRLAESGAGRIKVLQGDPGDMRLRLGDYRVRFTEERPDTLRIHASRTARRPTGESGALCRRPSSSPCPLRLCGVSSSEALPLLPRLVRDPVYEWQRNQLPHPSLADPVIRHPPRKFWLLSPKIVALLADSVALSPSRLVAQSPCRPVGPLLVAAMPRCGVRSSVTTSPNLQVPKSKALPVLHSLRATSHELNDRGLWVSYTKI